MTRRLTVAGAVVIVGVALLSSAQATLFGTIPSGNDTALVTIDPMTGTATAVGPIGFPDVQGLAGRASDMTLFGATGQPFNVQAGQILTIRPGVDATGTALGLPYGLPIGGLARSPLTGILYGTCTLFDTDKPDALCIVSQLDGAVAPVDPMQSLDTAFSIKGFDGLAFDAAGTLYASTRTFNPGEPRLYTVTPTTGIATAVGPIRDASNTQITAGVVGLEFVNGALYGSTDDGMIITIDPATAVYSLVGPTQMGRVQDLANLEIVAPTPTVTPTVPTPTPTPGPCGQPAADNPCVPGGGPAASDCQMEWLVSPVPPAKNGLPKNQVVCYEGDPRCDADADVKNHSCTFPVRICINNTDPRLACTPLDLSTFRVLKPNPKKLTDAADQANLAALEAQAQGDPSGFGVTVLHPSVTPGRPNDQLNLCSGTMSIVVPLKHGRPGRFRKTRRTLKIRGTTALLRRDTDSLKLECRPSTCGDGIVQADHETCDDGNRDSGDGCDRGCQIEVATPTPTDTPPPAASHTPTCTRTASPTNTPAVPTDTPTITPTPTDTPLGGIPTSTPSATPTSTPTPTMVTSVCGNGFLESGETCTSCPQDCVIHPCTATSTIETFAINLSPPLGVGVNGTDVLLGYRSDRVSIPGSGAVSSVAARVKNRPSNIIFSAFDFDYALHVVINRNSGLSAGRLFTVDFDTCSGAVSATPADFGCTISCSNLNGPVDGCTCAVSAP